MTLSATLRRPLSVDGYLLQPWEHKTGSGLVLRGYETPITGKPIVHFVHGNGFNGLVYLPMLRYLIPHADLVITNAQGHGGSDAGTAFLGWDNNAAMIHEILLHKRQQWGDVKVVGMGHSFGAILTTMMGAQEKLVFDRLLLLDPIYLPQTLASLNHLLFRLGLMNKIPMVSRTLKRRSQWPDRHTAQQYFEGRGVFRGWHTDALSAYVEHGLQEQTDGVHLLAPPWLEASVYARYANRIWPTVKKLRIPCHVIIGNKTFPYLKAGMERACRINSSITGEVMTGGHCFMQEHPQAVGERVMLRLTEAGVFTRF